jgi:anthranilate phosphoribosyltransferase
MKHIIDKLLSGFNLNGSESRQLMLSIGSAELSEVHISAVITAYRMREITIEELRGFRNALLELSIQPKLSSEDAIDMCGTGGDNFNSFNISTAAAFVVANAGGKVIKHGNYGVSSISGSSNVLEQLGYSFTTDSSALQRSLDKTGICFLHAPLFHPALKHAASVRRSLGVRTFFNMLGPLVNPAQPQYCLTGLYSLELMRKYNYLLQDENVKYTLVHSEDGCDEISLTAPFRIVTKYSEKVLMPEDMGMPAVTRSAIYGGDTLQSAVKIFTDVLSGKGTASQNNVVAVNAGFALQLSGLAASERDGIDRALEILREGRAAQTLKRFLTDGKPVLISTP